MNTLKYVILNSFSTYPVFHYPPLHSTTLPHPTPHHTTLYYTTQHCTTLHYTTLHYTTLHFTILHDTTLYYTTLYYTALHYNTLPYTTLIYIILQSPNTQSYTVFLPQRRWPRCRSCRALFPVLTPPTPVPSQRRRERTREGKASIPTVCSWVLHVGPGLSTYLSQAPSEVYRSCRCPHDFACHIVPTVHCLNNHGKMYRAQTNSPGV